jgi:acetyl esterase/lipase
MTPLPLDDAALEEARRVNRWLSRAPRFRIRSRLTPMLIQPLLRLTQIGADGRLRRRGIHVEVRIAECAGLKVPVRILRPSDASPRGVVLDIHGGGWVIGNPQVDDRLNAGLVGACGLAVVSVDYRLVPRVPLSDTMDDCLAAARWLLQGGVPQFEGLPVFVAGESAGAHLAAATLQRLQAWPELLGRIHGAVLYYGVYDLAGTAMVHCAGPETLVLDGPGMPAALCLLTPGMPEAERRRPPLSPLYGDLRGMPPALLFGGERDPLRDDTLDMAQRWRAVAGVELHILPEAPHGFIRLPTRMARIAEARTHAWLRERMAQAQEASPARDAAGRRSPVWDHRSRSCDDVI